MNLLQVRNKSYKGSTIHLDGSEFIGCTFIDCVFRWNGGPYKFGEGTAFGGFRAFITENQQIADAVSLLKSFNLLESEFAENWQRQTSHFVPSLKVAGKPATH